MNRPRRVLPVIVASQFAGTALWFAGNAVVGDLQQALHLPPGAVGGLTSAVQLGFIAGTLVFAALTLADRMPARWLFCACCLLGAVANLGLLVADGYYSLLGLRFATGLFLAGIYPVGMKIAASWYERGLGAAIGFLVGALVLGTAFPHLVRGLGHAVEWKVVIIAVSAMAGAGGILMVLLVPEGRLLRTRAPLDLLRALHVFRSRDFRAAALGYFGHMWELYAFWAFVPVVIAAHGRGGDAVNVSLWSFAVIGAGSIGCVVGGLLSERFGSALVAAVQIAASCALCLASPVVFALPTPAFLAVMVFWGVVVAGDSPQFSTLNARSAPPALVGTALTIVTCIGFAITIPAIQLLGEVAPRWGARWIFLLLAPGPALGLLALRPLVRERR